MSYSSEPLTALELYEIRTHLRQSAIAMAGLLGVNVNSYYHWERTGKIPKSISVAARFLATQTQIAEAPTEKARPIKKFRAQFLPGARFGSLLVVAHAPSLPNSRQRQVQVRCDCGKTLVLPPRDLEKMTKCSPACKFTPVAPTTAPADAGDGGDEDTLGLDATFLEELEFLKRKEREKQEVLNAAFDELNDEIAPYDDQTPVDAIGEWEEGL
jgi:hypothetical protein